MGEPSRDNTAQETNDAVIIIQPAKGGWLSSSCITDVEYQQFVRQYTATVRDGDDIRIRIMPCGDITPQAIMIADVLSQHPGVVVAEVPYSAGSAGTLIALACSNIVMSQCSFLSPLTHSISRLFRVPVGVVSNSVAYERRVVSHSTQPQPQLTHSSALWSSLIDVICSYTETAFNSHNASVDRILRRRFSGEDFDVVRDFFNTHADGTPLPYEWVPECVPIDFVAVTR